MSEVPTRRADGYIMVADRYRFASGCYNYNISYWITKSISNYNQTISITIDNKYIIIRQICSTQRIIYYIYDVIVNHPHIHCIIIYNTRITRNSPIEMIHRKYYILPQRFALLIIFCIQYNTYFCTYRTF